MFTLSLNKRAIIFDCLFDENNAAELKNISTGRLRFFDKIFTLAFGKYFLIR